MIIGIEGFLGDGKTIFMVRCAKIDYKNNRKIFSNFKLRGIEYTPLNIEDFLLTQNAEKFKNCSIFIDEITLFMDCRRSSRKENIAISTLLRQSRKRSIDIYYTCQNLDETDLRLIRYTSIFVIAQRCFEEINNKLKEIDNYRQYIIVDTRQREENVKRMNMEISQYYPYYDTDEIIESIYENRKKK
jgi:hypothetical protein